MRYHIYCFLIACLLLSKLTANAQHTYAMRTIDISEPEDTIKHHLHYAGPDSTLADMLIAAIKNGRLLVYDRHDYSLKNPLGIMEIKTIITPYTDTQLISDPINASEVIALRPREVNFNSYHKYGLLEKWDFDAATGKTNIKPAALALIADVLDEGASHSTVQPAFLLNYNDIKPILKRYEQYHPTSTLSSRIWNSYFLSDTRPFIIK